MIQLQKFEDNKVVALETQAKHEIAQFYFNDKFYYYMHAHLTEVQTIRENVDYMEDCKKTAQQLIKYSKLVRDSEDELMNFNYSKEMDIRMNINNTSQSPKRRLLTLDVRSYIERGYQAHFKASSNHSSITPDNSTSNSSANNSKEVEQMSILKKFVETYQTYVGQIKDNQATVDQLNSTLNDFSDAEKEFLAAIANNYKFADTIHGLRSEYEVAILSYLYMNGLMEAYEVDEQHIWLLGWLLTSKEQFRSWMKRPKDVISSLDQLQKVNKTEISILNDYLDDLIDQVIQRVVYNKIDNAAFGFHIYRGLVFNITDITNVTNCTNKELHCPCSPNRDPNDHNYCEPVLNTTNSTNHQPSASNSSRRLLTDAANHTNGSAPTANSTANHNSTGNHSGNSTAKDMPQAAAGVPKKSSNPFKGTKKVDLMAQKDQNDEFFVLTPYTVFCNLKTKFVGEKDIAGFLTAFKFIMTQYLYDELEHGYEKQIPPVEFA